MAKGIVEVLGAQCSIAGRTGGTAFAFIVLNLENGPLGDLSRRVQSRLSELIAAVDAENDVSFSVGVANFSHGDQRSQVMARLDLVIESARQSARNALQLAPEHAEAVSGLGSLGWRELIQGALQENRWRLVGQPVVVLGGQQVMHLEIMSRLVGEDGELVPAAQFMPMALRHQLMPDIDRALLELVSRVVGRGTDPDVRFAVNMSNQSLGNKEFVRWFQSFLHRLGKLAGSLSFELTEYACAVDTPMAREFASSVRKCGARFGIDHFGLSPTALQTLRDVPPDYIKLGAALVSEALRDETARSVLRAIVQLARSLEVEVIAQGVETSAQIEMLLADQVLAGQGYYFGAPGGL